MRLEASKGRSSIVYRHEHRVRAEAKFEDYWPYLFEDVRALSVPYYYPSLLVYAAWVRSKSTTDHLFRIATTEQYYETYTANAPFSFSFGPLLSLRVREKRTLRVDPGITV